MGCWTRSPGILELLPQTGNHLRWKHAVHLGVHRFLLGANTFSVRWTCCVLLWGSRFQPVEEAQDLSPVIRRPEAEYAVYAKAAKDLRFVINLLGPDGYQFPVHLPITIHCDNSAAVSHIKNVGATARTRHYENWLAYGRDQYLNRVSEPNWIGTELQVADIFTKALDKTTFLKFRAMLLNIPYDGVTAQLRALVNPQRS